MPGEFQASFPASSDDSSDEETTDLSIDIEIDNNSIARLVNSAVLNSSNIYSTNSTINNTNANTNSNTHSSAKNIDSNANTNSISAASSTLPSDDSSFSGRREWLSLNMHQAVKFFTIRRIGEGAAGNTPIQVERNNLLAMLKVICSKYKRMRKKNLKIHYMIRNSDRTGTPLVFRTDIDQSQLLRDLEIFYIQADDMSFIEIGPL